MGAPVGGLEGRTVGAVDDLGRQDLDNGFTGYDCDKIKSAAGWGAAFGAVSGARGHATSRA